MFNCALCDSDIPENALTRKRKKKSKSGLLFCQVAHKNEALKLGRMGDERFLNLVPKHYGTFEDKYKPCLNCGRIFTRIAKQKFCRQSCAARYKGNLMLQEWLDGNHDLARSSDGSIRAWARRFLLEEVQYACSRCRWSETSFNGTIPLEIDHIDGNWKNSARENLRVLCPNCHALTETYKFYNKGKNEESRYQYYRDRGWW